MESLQQDVRYALRTLKRNPGYAVVTVAMLALGIGANTAIFSILNALVLRELPVQEPGRLVQVSGLYRNGAKVPLSFPMFEELERGQRAFSGLVGWSGTTSSNVEIDGHLVLAEVRTVTGNYFSELGAAPYLGRLIATSDAERDNAAPVAVISHEYWSRRFGSEPSVVGRTISIEGRLFTIIGVTRKWFTGMSPGSPAEITISVRASPVFDLQNKSSLWVFATGRLRGGVTIDQARAQLQSFWPQLLEATLPTTMAGERRQSFLAMKLDMQSASTGINDVLRSQYVRPLSVLMGIVGLILLIVCVNLASLALARATARRREISTRVALGASRLQIVRQLMTESALLSVVGALLAVGFSYWGSQLLIAVITSGSPLPITLDVRPDWRVFSATAVAAILSGAIMGLAPAWQMSRVEPATVLRESERTLAGGSNYLGKALIVAQIALSLVLLQGAGLFLRTLDGLRSVDPGFRRADVMQVRLNPSPGGYKDVDMASYRKQLIDRVASLPGVLSVGFSTLSVPAAGETGWRDTVARAREDANKNEAVLATAVFVSPGFFDTLGIPILSGRDFDWTDNERHPRVAIIDSAAVKQLGLSEDLIRERVRYGVQPELQDLQVVGVVRSARLINLRTSELPLIYVPSAQHTRFGQRGNLLVRTRDSAAFMQGADEAVRSLGREYVARVETLDHVSEMTLWQELATAMLSSFFGLLALILSGVGLFGLISYAVSRRTREVGIRIALGSSRGGILRLVLREAVFLALAGVALGIPFAWVASRLIENMLFGLSPGDPLTMAAVSGILIAVGTIAGYLPARRAMNMEPMTALRCD